MEEDIKSAISMLLANFASQESCNLFDTNKIIELKALLDFFLDSKERMHEAEITHSEHPLKYYVVRLDRISPYEINIQPLVNPQVCLF